MVRSGAYPLVLVGHHSDGLISAVHEACRRRAIDVVRLTRKALCEQTTTSYNGGRAEVSPDRPLLLRRDLWTSTSTRDDLFIADEQRAHLWAIGALTNSPVVNRPTENLFPDRYPRSLLVDLISKAPYLVSLLPKETYLASLEFDQAKYESESFIIDGDRIDDSFKSDYLPHRIRPRLEDGWLLLQATVLGNRVWIVNDTYGHLDWLRELSVVVSRTLDLQFCLIFWRVKPRTHQIQLARISSHPEAIQLRDHLGVVSEALVEILLS